MVFNLNYLIYDDLISDIDNKIKKHKSKLSFVLKEIYHSLFQFNPDSYIRDGNKMPGL